MNEWIIVKESHIVPGDKGCYAIKDIPKGTEIIEYKGKRVSKEISDKLTAKHAPKGQIWVFTLNDHYDIDGTRGGNEARFINHSDQPNCEPVVHEGDNPKEDEVWIEALRDIKKGEELCYDYGFDELDEDYPWYTPSEHNDTFKGPKSHEEKKKLEENK